MTILALYSPQSEWKQGDYPTPPYVCIYLKEFALLEERILLSPKLMTDKEIDEAIDSLKSKVEDLRPKAKEKLSALLTRMAME